MNDRMKDRYRVFRRGWGTYYSENLRTGKQESLRTRDKAEAYRLVAARNEVEHQPAFSLDLARVYWKAVDPEASTRTWQHVMNEALKLKQGPTRERWQAAIRPAAFDPIRDLLVLETQAHHFLAVLERGSVSTNVYLRRIHNLALDLGWLPWPVVPRKRWPTLQFKAKRAITAQEHRAIIDREPNPEFRVFYELLWEIGGSQTDVATLTDENFDREKRILAYQRHKTGTLSRIQFGERVEQLLLQLSQHGPLFPKLAVMHETHRAKEFRRRCLGRGIAGVSLHSYRYAWAERAKVAGYPERFVQEALGHSSKAVHRAYARNAEVIIPSLEDYENRRAERKVIPFPGSPAGVPTFSLPNAQTTGETPASSHTAQASATLSRSAR